MYLSQNHDKKLERVRKTLRVRSHSAQKGQNRAIHVFRDTPSLSPTITVLDEILQKPEVHLEIQ
jgi:hypothetical protein